jgi:hypothetical protein
MPDLLFAVKATAEIHVWDKDGNLISSSPAETETQYLTAAELDERGIPYDPTQAVNYTVPVTTEEQ